MTFTYSCFRLEHYGILLEVDKYHSYQSDRGLHQHPQKSTNKLACTVYESRTWVGGGELKVVVTF